MPALLLKKSEKATEDTERTVQELHAKIGQLTMENDIFERGLERIHGPSEKKWQAQRKSTITCQCLLLDIRRSSFYYIPEPVSDEELALM